jgi:hypothetical protein
MKDTVSETRETIRLRSAIPGVTDEEIARVFEPSVVEEFEADSPGWLKVLRDVDSKLERQRPTWDHWLNAQGQRTVDQVNRRYDEKWSRIDLEQELLDGRRGWFEWRGRRLRARTVGHKRVFQLWLARVLDWLKPSSVLEVGSGWGMHLLALAVQFPDIRFSGVELTEAGVRTARTLALDPATPRLLERVVVDGVRDRAALSRLDLQQGSADALPVPDKSVDLVMTVLALEQMERIRDAALRELARVARRHVVMIEPFRDWNSEGRQLEYIRRLDYWSAAIDDLPAFGLTPIAADADIPQKLTSRAGIVVAEVA